MKQLVKPGIEVIILCILGYAIYTYVPWTEHLKTISSLPTWQYCLLGAIWVLYKFINPLKTQKEDNGDEIPVKYENGYQLPGEYKSYDSAKMNAYKNAKEWAAIDEGSIEIIQEGEDEWGQFFVMKATVKVLGTFISFFLIPYEKHNTPERNNSGNFE